MNKPWELTDGLVARVLIVAGKGKLEEHTTMFQTWEVIAQAAQKRMLEYQKRNLVLRHDIKNFITGEHCKDCPACKLLKEFGID